MSVVQRIMFSHTIAVKMFRRLSNIGPRFANPILTTRQMVILNLYASYIWSPTQREYIDSRRRDYEKHYKTIRYGSDDGKTLDDHSVDSELNNLLNRRFDCPIPQMPKFLRIYRVFSTAFVIYSSIKYALLCSIYYGWLGIDNSYACYLPGRLALFTDPAFVFQLPWLGLIVFLFHLIYRSMWYRVDRLKVDGLLFLLYGRDRILDKQYEVIELNDQNMTSPESAYRKYLCNRIFYRRILGPQGRVVYKMKHHRTIEHRKQMENLMVILRLLFYTFGFGGAIITLIAFYTYLRHDYFDLSYPSCRIFSNSVDNEDFEWSFGDKFRLCYLFFDLLEGTIFSVDTLLAIALPLGNMMVLSHDLRLRFDALRGRLHDLNKRFRIPHYLNSDWAIKLNTTTITHPDLKFLESVQEESERILFETLSTFRQVGCVDEYVRRLSTFVLLIWLVLNSSYQASLLVDLYPKGELVKYFNAGIMAFVYIGLTFSYIMFSRPYHRAQLLYRELCVAMAICPPVQEMKIAWRWLLEYYNDVTKYSLHLIGKSYALSNLNALRCASWFATCTVVLFSMLRH